MCHQELARERGNVSMEGEAYKWLGHAHNKLSEGSKAGEHFSQVGPLGAWLDAAGCMRLGFSAVGRRACCV